MENIIKHKFNSWNVMKNRDKIRRLDNVIIRAVEHDNRKYIKIMLMILVLLKRVTSKDIEFENFDVKKIKVLKA